MVATGLGVVGSDDRWDDLTPKGRSDLVGMLRRHRDAAAEHLNHPDPDERHAARVLTGYLDVHIGQHEAGEHLRDISHIYSRFTEIRDIFVIMPRGSQE